MPIISGEYLDQLFAGHRRPSSPSMPAQPKKEIFVTVGATATFHELIRRVAGNNFQQAAKTLGFTGMNVQCGNSIQEYLDNRCASIPGFEVRAFGFSDKGLTKQMRATQEGDGRLKGVVISHAGAGSVLDAMRLSCSIIVVPNESLLDNHQADLAEELEEQGYATSGTVKDLSDDLRRCVERAATYEWPPANQGKVIEDVIEGTAVKEEVVREEITNRHMD